MKISISMVLISLILSLLLSCGSSKKIQYETVSGDSLKTRIYTLHNGLTVFLSVNKEQPRIQAYTPLRVGAKNDSPHSTGMAHYLEHLMFKGTSKFSTSDYEKEKILLSQIENLYETYRTEANAQVRKEIYATIDSLSLLASNYAIPNEYDRLMSLLGASNSNAYTSYDATCYMEEIPSNQLENWLLIQSERFRDVVVRGFHTELETVYEEKNMSLSRDDDKSFEALASLLYRKHPYGTQTVLGTPEHLKNPSIAQIKEFYNKWYVPNNMAICLSGDFDPDEAILLIDKYFGTLRPKPIELTSMCDVEHEIVTPRDTTVFGVENEYLLMGWRLPAAGDLQSSDIALLIQMILYNEAGTGLINRNLLQEQKILDSYCFFDESADYSNFIIHATPKERQTLNELHTLLLSQIDLLRQGDFPESMLHSISSNLNLQFQQSLSDNRSRAQWLATAFINSIKWENQTGKLNRIANISKQSIVDYANKYFSNNYAVVYKREGEDKSMQQIEKPTISPIATNRDVQSDFFYTIESSVLETIEPIFTDYSKELVVIKEENRSFVCKRNSKNRTFSFSLRLPSGYWNEPLLSLLPDYFRYVSPSGSTPLQLKDELYAIACKTEIDVREREIRFTVSGLSENFLKALSIVQNYWQNSIANHVALDELKKDILKSRADAKQNQMENYRRLSIYLRYGSYSPASHQLSNEEILQLSTDELINLPSQLTSSAPEILYWGPLSADSVVSIVSQYFPYRDSSPAISPVDVQPLDTDESIVYIVPWDTNQLIVTSFINLQSRYESGINGYVSLYNEYFGMGAASVVFQEMREHRALAYSSWARVACPYNLQSPYLFTTFIATQNDKLLDALSTFEEIIAKMPKSQKNFDVAKNSLLTQIATNRINDQNQIESYLNAANIGETKDPREKLYNNIKEMKLDDLCDFQAKNIFQRKLHHAILGRQSDIDQRELSHFGKIIHLTTDEIFGY